MRAELAAFHKMDTDEIADFPTGANLMKPKWFFAEKKDDFGRLARRKDRLLYEWFTQRQVIDYVEMFSPTASNATLRAVRDVAAHREYAKKKIGFHNILSERGSFCASLDESTT